jgi:DNA modification methylase
LIFFAEQYMTDLMRILVHFDFKYKGICHWHKTNPAMNVRHQNFVSSSESLLFMSRGSPTFHFIGQNDMHNVYSSGRCSNSERIKDLTVLNSKGKHPNLHEAQKPVALCEYYLSIISNPGEIILDSFAGLGTINYACLKSGRSCYGMEINQKYYAAGKERLEEQGDRYGKYTNQKSLTSF